MGIIDCASFEPRPFDNARLNKGFPGTDVEPRPSFDQVDGRLSRCNRLSPTYLPVWHGVLSVDATVEKGSISQQALRIAFRINVLILEIIHRALQRRTSMVFDRRRCLDQTRLNGGSMRSTKLCKRFLLLGLLLMDTLPAF